MVNFEALIGHNLGRDSLHTLPELLDSSWSRAHSFFPIFEGYPVIDSARDKWYWSRGLANTQFEAGQGRLLGPEGFSGFSSHRCIRFHHFARWECFLEDNSVRARLRGVCRNIAETLKSKTIAYIPDSSYKPELALDLLLDGKTIDEIVEWLYVNCGRPADIDALIAKSDLNRQNLYYVETL
ncbi:MAG TPA: hypothetical protein VEZ90_03775 [Blastocatellia bacterium]|nr:hypothetical protein [Blastocatellia bacterium]